MMHQGAVPQRECMTLNNGGSCVRVLGMTEHEFYFGLNFYTIK